MVSGQIFSLQPILEARNDSGQRDLHLSGTAVGLSVASATTELSGNNSQSWSSGQAAFEGLAVTCEDGSAFELQAAGTGLQDVQTSLTCDVVASKLVFATQPAHGGGPTLLHGTSFETQPVLEAQDADGARDHHAIGQVALSVHTGNAALTGQTSRDWTSGLADFAANSLTLSAQNDGERVVL